MRPRAGSWEQCNSAPKKTWEGKKIQSRNGKEVGRGGEDIGEEWDGVIKNPISEGAGRKTVGVQKQRQGRGHGKKKKKRLTKSPNIRREAEGRKTTWIQMGVLWRFAKEWWVKRQKGDEALDTQGDRNKTGITIVGFERGLRKKKKK